MILKSDFLLLLKSLKKTSSVIYSPKISAEFQNSKFIKKTVNNSPVLNNENLATKSKLNTKPIVSMKSESRSNAISNQNNSTDSALSVIKNNNRGVSTSQKNKENSNYEQTENNATDISENMASSQYQTEFNDQYTQFSQPKNFSDEYLNSATNINILSARIRDCDRCELCVVRSKIVFGIGAVNSKIMFIGEAPGKDEDLTGQPFVGRAGNLLRKMILYLGLKPESVYITNVVKCRPPENRKPTPKEVNACNVYLQKQISFIKPKLIILVGDTALKTFIPGSPAITQARGQIFKINDIDSLVVFHPAYLLRNRNKLNEAYKDFRIIKEYLINIS